MEHQLRQVRGLQVQAEKLCTERASFEQVLEFGKYSRELKASLESTVTQEFTLNLIQEIPDLETELKKSDSKSKAFDALLLLVGGVLPFLTKESRKVDKAKGTIREMQGKYASIELLLKNSQ